MKNNISIEQFLMNSFNLLKEHPQQGRYFHHLTEADNSPVVVHNVTNQLTFVVQGHGTAYLNDEIYKIEKKDILLIEAGTTHRFTAGEEGLTLFHIHIPDDGRDNDRNVLEGEDYNRFTI